MDVQHKVDCAKKISLKNFHFLLDGSKCFIKNYCKIHNRIQPDQPLACSDKKWLKEETFLPQNAFKKCNSIFNTENKIFSPLEVSIFYCFS